MSRPCLDLAIGTTCVPNTIYNLKMRGVADPSEWTFIPYSKIETGGDGLARGFGYPTASWTWETLEQFGLNVFLGFLGASAASVVVYIRTYTDSGRGLEGMIEYFKAVMHRPVDGNGKSMISESRLPIYNDVTVQFTRLEVVVCP